MFSFIAADDPKDPSTQSGASRLAEKIAGYWRERGYEANVSVRPDRFTKEMRGIHWILQSSTLNGLPTRRLGEELKDAA